MPEVASRGYFRIDLANNCNIRCIMCQAYNSLPVNAMEFLDFDKFQTRTRRELGKWKHIQLGNTAEATIHPRFADYLRYVRSEAPDTTIHIVTNGKTLHKFAALINEVGNCVVQISMDSIRKEAHEYIREGSYYDRAIANIAMLDLKRTQVLLSFTLMRSNIEEYAEMVAFCRERGYHMSAFPMIVRSERGVVPFNLLRESLWFNRDHLRSWLQQHYGAEYPLMIGTASGATLACDEFTCNAHYHDLNMDALGNVNLCGKVTLGNLAVTDLHSLWNNSVAEEFRLQVETDRGPCMTCDYRQRCTCPSMAVIDNHFSEEIVGILPIETRHSLRYDREISDDEARWLFVRDLSPNIGIFDIEQSGNSWLARKVFAGSAPGVYGNGEPLVAGSRHELHELMRRQADSTLCVRLLESYGSYNLVAYMGRYWALPLCLGHLDIVKEGDRNKHGVLVADTLEELKKLCGCVDPPRLIGNTNGYNLVAYDGKYWGIPLSFGPFDLTEPHNRSKPELLAAKTRSELEYKCGSLLKVLAGNSR